MIIYFFHFTNQAFLGDRELKRKDSNNDYRNNKQCTRSLRNYPIVIPVPLNHCFSNVSEIYYGDFEQKAV